MREGTIRRCILVWIAGSLSNLREGLQAVYMESPIGDSEVETKDYMAGSKVFIGRREKGVQVGFLQSW